MRKPNFSFYSKQVIIKSKGKICKYSRDLTKAELFKHVIHIFLDYLRKKDSPLLDVFAQGISKDEQEKSIINLLQRISTLSLLPARLFTFCSCRRLF